MQVSIFKSSKREYLYLYVPHSIGLAEVPDGLLAQFGESEKVMDLMLTPSRSLASAKAEDVLAALDDKGYYLQMPPLDPI